MTIELLNDILALEDADQTILNRIWKESDNSLITEADLPQRWRTFSVDPEKDYAEQWLEGLKWAASEVLRLHGAGERPPHMGGDKWREPPSVENLIRGQERELLKCTRLLLDPPVFEPAREGAVLCADTMQKDTGLWDYPRGLRVERDEENGTTWCGKTTGLKWNPKPTSGTWLWLKEEMPDTFSFSQRFKTLEGMDSGALLIMAFAAAPLDASTDWEHASGPGMGYYFNYFDAYHFSVSRAGTGFCNLRRCGPGLIMLASGSDPAEDLDRWYETRIVKDCGAIDLYVDGVLCSSYLDIGSLTPRLKTGRIGFRHVQIYKGCHRDVRVIELKQH